MTKDLPRIVQRQLRLLQLHRKLLATLIGVQECRKPLGRFLAAEKAERLAEALANVVDDEEEEKS
jgi:hypothetical protein